MDAWRVGFLSLDETQRLVKHVLDCWPPERRDARWVAAYRYASRVFEVWQSQVESEIARQEARDVDACERAELAHGRTAKPRLLEEGATRVGGGRHGPTGDSLVDVLLATKIAAVDAMLQDAHAKGRGKEGDSP